MKVFRLVLILVTLPLLVLIPYFLFVEGDHPEKKQNDNTAFKSSGKNPTISIGPSKSKRKKLILSEHRFDKKNFQQTSEATNIHNSINYFLYSPPKPWPEGLSFPLIIHLSDHNDTAYSAEYVSQNQLSLAFPAFSIIPDTGDLYNDLEIEARSRKTLTPSERSLSKMKKKEKKINAKILRSHSRKILSPIKSLIEDITAKHPVDTNRVYVIGCGFGAATLFHFIEKNPDTFASAVALSSTWETDDFNKFTGTPLLIITGKDNGIFSSFNARSFAKAIKDRGGNVKYQAFESMPHTCSYKNFYSRKVWKWMFSHKQ